MTSASSLCDFGLRRWLRPDKPRGEFDFVTLGPEGEQMTSACPRPFPLFPVAQANTSSQPVIELDQFVVTPAAAQEVLALVAFTADNSNESRFVSGLLEIGFVLARDLLFPFSMAMAPINGIPHSMVQSPG